jgi:two-component system LytT family sensor kinase
MPPESESITPERAANRDDPAADQTTAPEADSRLVRLWGIRRLRWPIIVGCWTAVGLLSAAHWHYFFVMRDPYTWWELLRIKVILWYLWGGTTLFILWLGRRFRPEGAHWPGQLFALAVFSFAVVAAYLMVYTLAVVVHLGQPLTAANWNGMLRFVIGMHSTFFYLAYWATLGIQYAVDYSRRYREQQLRAARLKAQLAEAQLASLRANVQPHFLFNALNTVASMVVNEQPHEAYDMLAELSELLRQSLRHDASQTVTLKEELDFVDRYLAILKARFADRLCIVRQIEPEALALEVPSLILQPVVENAVKHGLDETTRPIRLTIDARVEAGRLRIAIGDDGPGLPAAFRPDACDGLGLKSTSARLAAMYGRDQRFAIAPRPGGGTRVELEWPARVHVAPREEQP